MKNKPYKEKCIIPIWINGRKIEYKSEVEVIDLPLGDLLDIYTKLKKPNLFARLFNQDYFYYRYAKRDVKEALDKIKITTEYKYLKILKI
jgi:hypothetical protein